MRFQPLTCDRMSRNRWATAEAFEIPLTPLIDIIFILIVFFLVATTFYTEERDLDIRLPEGTEGDAITSEDETFVINVRKGGILVVGGAIVTLDELEARLRRLEQQDTASVEVRGDTDARHGRIMAVMNLCKKTGVRNYSLTQRIVRETP